jgi:hypothetical protein
LGKENALDTSAQSLRSLAVEHEELPVGLDQGKPGSLRGGMKEGSRSSLRSFRSSEKMNCENLRGTERTCLLLLVPGSGLELDVADQVPYPLAALFSF